MAPKRKLSEVATARASKRKVTSEPASSDIPGAIDDVNAARASPAPIAKDEIEKAGLNSLTQPKKTKAKIALDPESDVDPDDDEDEEVLKAAISRPPPVHSSYLPLPWKGRLGYVGLNHASWYQLKHLMLV